MSDWDPVNTSWVPYLDRKTLLFAAWKWTLSPWLKRAYSWLLGNGVMGCHGSCALGVPTHGKGGIMGSRWQTPILLQNLTIWIACLWPAADHKAWACVLSGSESHNLSFGTILGSREMWNQTNIQSCQETCSVICFDKRKDRSFLPCDIMYICKSCNSWPDSNAQGKIWVERQNNWMPFPHM